MAEQAGRECRHQGDRDDQRAQQREHDDHRHLGKEHAGEPGEEHDRGEHRDRGQRAGDDPLEPSRQQRIREVPQAPRVATAAEAERRDGRRRDVELEDGRLLGVLGKPRAQAVERRPHVVDGGVEIDAPVKLQLHA